MRKVFHRNIWYTYAVQIHVDPPPIQLNKSENDAKSEKDSVKNKLHRDPTSEKSDIY